MLDLEVRLARDNFLLHIKVALTTPVAGLFGPSGSGKSTLLRVIAGITQPDAGYIAIDGMTVFDSTTGINLPPHRRQVGIVVQDNQLFPHLNVRDNLLFGTKRSTGHERSLSLARIVELLEIGSLEKKRPGQLSGGEKQRVALGRALLSSPKLLLLDEPMASLDERLKLQILPFLRRVVTELKVPLIYVSHQMAEILQLTQQIMLINAETLIAHGALREVIRRTPALALLQATGFENVLKMTTVSHDERLGYTAARFQQQKLILPYSTARPGTDVYVTVRANNIAIARAATAEITIQNQLPGTITQLTEVHHRCLVEIDIGEPLIAEVTAKAVHDLALKRGERVYCLIKTQAFTPL